MSKKIGRNDKCPCGSGKKYKKCCIDSENIFDTTQVEIESSTIFNKYNSIDLIKAFAGLTLLPENHGKNIRLEELTYKAVEDFNEKVAAISREELETYLGECYASHYMEDPSTNLFTDLITFYGGDYLIFPGITDGGCYVLSNLLVAIYNGPESGIPRQFKINCLQASKLILNLSNKIVQRLGYSRYMQDHVERENIHLPSGAQLNELKDAIVFTEDQINELLNEQQISDQALACFIWKGSDSEQSNEFMQDSPLLKQPIIHYNGEYVIASPATLSYALTEWILSQARTMRCLQQVSKAYHDIIWNNLQLNFGILGLSRMEVPTFSEANNTNLREAIYRFDDDKLVYIQYDSGETDCQERKQKIINETLALPQFSGYEFMDITLISSMGRELFSMFSRIENSKSIGMPIYDFETFVKLKEFTAFDLWKYACAREKLGNNPLFGASFLDVFKVYKEKDDSFYLSDDSSEIMLNVQPGYAENLYQDAKLLSDEHSATRIMEGDRLANIPVERKDKYAPIYFSKSDFGSKVQFLVTGYHQPIWVSSTKDINTTPEVVRGLYFEMGEAIAYWLWQCQEQIKRDIAVLGDLPLTFKFEFDQEESFHQIERNFDRDPDFINHFAVNVGDNEIFITIPSSINPYLYGADNEGERVLLNQLLNGFNQLLISKKKANIEEDRIEQIIDKVAPLGVKKKIFLIDTADNLLLDPSNLIEYRYIQNYDISVVLDGIVPGLGKLCPEIGDIRAKADKTKLTRNIVMRFLLPKLQSTICQYQNDTLLQRLFSLNESLIWKREDLRIKTPTRIACFVSKEEQTMNLRDSLTKLNQTTMAVRCLIEHLAAEPNTGNKIISTTAIDELIAIMSAIIDWGSLGDQIEFDLFDIRMGILPSGRVGTSKKVFKEVLDPYYTSKTKENVQDAQNTFEQVFPQNNPKEGSEVPESLDKAFVEEFGISFTRLCEVVNDLGIVAYEQFSTFASIPKHDLFIEINKFDHTYSEEEFDTAINYLSLWNRGEAKNVPEGYDHFDISPWRFNRRLSLLRKPLVQVDNPEDPQNPIIYWGFRQLLSSRSYWFDQIVTDRFRVSENGPVQRVLGKIVQQRGSRLVQSVIEEVGSEELVIDSEVPINSKSVLKHDKDIGDVDVMVIDTNEKVIYSLECKSMAQSRNIKEMVEEVGKLFGSSSKKGWIEKHVERDTWLRSNLDLLGDKYKLDLSEYTVKSFFVTQEDMLTPYLTTKQPDLPFVTLYDLKENGIDALK
ncbi:YecA family protein [Marinifilum flexuosum]|uniref:YecA family protein n=1 Tax=Marinifilum flexuosum TaxID=1117708 RepID=UPI0024943A41|nr:SEC-C metal-binding domain-containing protein [Marinifilum flexuosum]